jgi:TolB-like protein/lipopolysaccharide biosynthesis regulator YciM
MAFPLPEKPSIAVLPFDNISADKSQDYFSDGITEEIITALSKTPKLFVIARNSVFIYKDKPVKVQQVAEDLGVLYVLEGSVRIAGDQARITAQMIDAMTGHHLWSERYDRKMEDIFTIQDEITLKIVSALQVKLTEGEHALLLERGTNNLSAYLKGIESLYHFRRFTKDENARARKLAEEAIALDSQYPLGWTMVAWTLLMDVESGSSKSPKEDMDQVLKITQKLRDLGEFQGAHYQLGCFYLLSKQHDKAIDELKKALELVSSNSSDINVYLGTVLTYSGKAEEAIGHIKKGMRLNPMYPAWYLNALSRAYRVTGKYQEAIEAAEGLLRRGVMMKAAHTHLAISYSLLGESEKAQSHVDEIFKLDPEYSIEGYAKANPFKDRVLLEHDTTALRKAGLPEHPPLKLPDKPSIAVLPFDNMSKDPEQEYFADGMTDDLITDLSKISGLFIIARNSTFQYKGKAVDVKKVSQDLGIRYVLEGSVRKAGDKVRINAQLIDATTGGHLWAERYDGQMEDIFSLQDKITQKIVSALAVRLTSGEKENLASKGTDNIEAYDAFMRGWQHYLRDTPESFARAIADFKKALEIDPDYSRAYAALALIHLKIGSSKEWHEALKTDYFTARVKARHFLNMAMKKPTSLAYRVASSMDLKRRMHDKAFQNAKKAIALNPADAESQFSLAAVLIYSGRPKEAMKAINAVMRLDPNKMADCLKLIGIAHFCLEEYEKAIASFNRSLEYKSLSWVYDWLASAHANIGNAKDAQAAFEIEKRRWLQVSGKGETATITKLDLQPTVYSYPFKDPDVTRRFVDGLIKAGWPEPHRYYEVYKENKLTGEELRDLVTGRTQVLAGFAGGGWTQNFGKDGNVAYQGFGMKDNGKFWIESDQCCITYDKMMANLPLCADLYRNPAGTIEKKDEYLQVNDFGIYPVSYVD